MAMVLIVEDELAIAELLADVLRDEGHQVAVAGNGRQALQIASKDRPAVVLTDFMMPVMDGPSFLQAMGADGNLKDVPVILMSSLPESTVAQRATGYRVFLRKPFRIFDVVDIVSRLSANAAGQD
jgi:CheY-like chemotaxis protein